MPKATLTHKGQVTLPKAVRQRLRVQAGDRISFRETEGGAIVVEADNFDLMELRGSIKPRGRTVTVADMDRTILATAARKK